MVFRVAEGPEVGGFEARGFGVRGGGKGGALGDLRRTGMGAASIVEPSRSVLLLGCSRREGGRRPGL